MVNDPVRKLRVVLADDHPVLRHGLRCLLDAQPDMVVTAEVNDGRELVESVAKTEADVAIVDLAMPVMGGVEATALLKAAAPGIKILALSAYDAAEGVERMLGAGAAGYIVKGASADDVVRAVRCVASGGTYLDPQVANNGQTGGKRGEAGLSEREHAVLRRIAEGHALKEIATTMEISVRTVETYKQRAMEKLSLKTRADIIRHAVAQGWLAKTP